MSKRLIFRGLAPALFVTVALAAAFVVPPRGTITPDVLACTGPGVGCGVPGVTGVSPNSGIFSGGTTVTITGHDFNNTGLVVQFGSAVATSPTINSDTQITVVSPAHAAGLVDVFVKTTAGMSVANSFDKFTYRPCTPGPGNAPYVSGLSPNFGLTSGGTTVTITGCSFTGALRVKFGTVAATGFTVVDDATITATTPAQGVGTVGVRVATAWGTSAFVPAGDFTYTNGPCVKVSESASPPSSTSAGTTVTFTASATGCTHPNPFFQFWMLAPGGSWTIAQAYFQNATFIWNTTGLLAGVYRYSVWVRDASSSTTYDTYYPGVAYQLTLAPCTSASASASPASTQTAGMTVTITATSSGCPNPRYEFWLQPPGGSWMVAQAYSSNANFTWNTAPGAGVYHYSVWVRDAGSSASYDTFFPGTAYTLTSTPCTSATASAAPPSAQPSGTTVSISASASTCPNARFEFWIQAPGGSWMVAQAYSSNGMFNWDTTGLVAGTYHYSVWARDASSGASYDAFFPGTAYTLTSTPCTSVSASTAPTSPQASGTVIAINASSVGCSKPLYEFWIQAPGGSWTIAQAYSTNASFNWTTTGLPPGTYRYSVWVRDSGSAGSYDQFVPGTAYTLT